LAIVVRKLKKRREKKKKKKNRGRGRERKEEEEVEKKKRFFFPLLKTFFFLSFRCRKERKILSVPFYVPQTPSPRFIDGSLPRRCFGSAARLLPAALRGEHCPGEREVFFCVIAFFFCFSVVTSFPAIVEAPMFPFPASRV